jgi:gamma-glutamyltranspeptidase/glutathione hydrolase
MQPRKPWDDLILKFFRRAVVLAALPLLAGCGIGHEVFGIGGGADSSLGQGAPAPSVFGYAVADEPEAALVGRQILNLGGNAADAAAAEGFALAVTLPSRAGLGGGGACVMKMPDAQGNPQPAVTLTFPPGAPAAAGGSRPAAVPALVRGLLALQARYGVLPFPAVIVPAERLASGTPVSPALETDLQVVGPALLADPAAAAVFGGPGGGVLPAGAMLSQPDLAATLEAVRTQGVEGFYAGGFAGQFVQAADLAGGNLSPADFSSALPVFGQPDTSSQGGTDIVTLPVPPAGTRTLPASAGFAALDKNGGVVVCAVTMNNLFGTGRIAAGTGVLLAASPRAAAAPVLAAGIAFNGEKFRAAVAGTGQSGAAGAVTAGLANALANNSMPVPEPGRADIISCPGGVPGGEASCTASADPRGNGLAVGGR